MSSNVTTATVKVDGVRELQVQLKTIQQESDKELIKAIAACAVYVHRTAIKMLQEGARSGRIYTTRFWTDAAGRLRQGKSRPPHQASAAGEAPKSDSGNLVANTTIAFENNNREATVGSRAPAAGYGYLLELGTSKIEPRPWLEPSLLNSMKYIEERLMKAWDSAAAKGGVK